MSAAASSGGGSAALSQGAAGGPAEGPAAGAEGGGAGGEKRSRGGRARAPGQSHGGKCLSSPGHDTDILALFLVWIKTLVRLSSDVFVLKSASAVVLAAASVS